MTYVFYFYLILKTYQTTLVYIMHSYVDQNFSSIVPATVNNWVGTFLLFRFFTWFHAR